MGDGALTNDGSPLYLEGSNLLGDGAEIRLVDSRRGLVVCRLRGDLKIQS
jgi:hypothetical protein